MFVVFCLLRKRRNDTCIHLLFRSNFLRKELILRKLVCLTEKNKVLHKPHSTSVGCKEEERSYSLSAYMFFQAFQSKPNLV